MLKSDEPAYLELTCVDCGTTAEFVGATDFEVKNQAYQMGWRMRSRSKSVPGHLCWRCGYANRQTVKRNQERRT